MNPLPLTLAQRSILPGSNARSILPAPETPAQAVAYFIAGALLLAAVFALVIWIKRHNE